MGKGRKKVGWMYSATLNEGECKAEARVDGPRRRGGGVRNRRGNRVLAREGHRRATQGRAGKGGGQQGENSASRNDEPRVPAVAWSYFGPGRGQKEDAAEVREMAAAGLAHARGAAPRCRFCTPRGAARAVPVGGWSQGGPRALRIPRPPSRGHAHAPSTAPCTLVPAPSTGQFLPLLCFLHLPKPRCCCSAPPPCSCGSGSGLPHGSRRAFPPLPTSLPAHPGSLFHRPGAPRRQSNLGRRLPSLPCSRGLYLGRVDRVGFRGGPIGVATAPFAPFTPAGPSAGPSLRVCYILILL